MNEITKRTKYDWTLEILSLLALIWAFIPVFFMKKLGEHVLIPIHFNAAGRADGWGGTHFLWINALMCLGFYLLFLLSDRYYKIMNFPVKVTPENADDLYRIGVRMMRHMKFLSILIVAYLNNSSFALALGYQFVSDSYFLSVVGILLGVVLFSHFVKMLLYK